MKNSLHEKKPNGLALIPFVIFIAIYMGAGIYYQVKGTEMAFYQFPSVTAMFLAVLAAFIMFKGTINEKFDVFAKGAANVDILTMLMIYILAGAFAQVAANMGGRESTVNLGLSLIPVQFLAAGLFVISAFMGTATGSSMGTVSAVIPIAVGIAEKGGLSLTVVIGAVVGGAMFGDNLSMISDTTIAATRSQRCEMRDKFRVNFLVALPAALVTLVLLLIVGRPEVVMPLDQLPFDLIKVAPYLRPERVLCPDHRHFLRRHHRHLRRRYDHCRLCPKRVDRLYQHERGVLPDAAVRRYVGADRQKRRHCLDHPEAAPGDEGQQIRSGGHCRHGLPVRLCHRQQHRGHHRGRRHGPGRIP